VRAGVATHHGLDGEAVDEALDGGDLDDGERL
jgi:hypothetical protein